MEDLTGKDGPITVGQLREWLAGLPTDRIIAMSQDDEGNGFNTLADAEASVLYDQYEDLPIHECDDTCEAYRRNEREFRGLPADSTEWVECEWGDMQDKNNTNVHVVMFWPAG